MTNLPVSHDLLCDDKDDACNGSGDTACRSGHHTSTVDNVCEGDLRANPILENDMGDRQVANTGGGEFWLFHKQEEIC